MARRAPCSRQALTMPAGYEAASARNCDTLTPCGRAPVGAPCSLLLRMHHRGIDVQGHAVPVLQGRPGTRRLTSCSTSLDALVPADPLPPVVRRRGTRQRAEAHQSGKRVLPVPVSHVLQALRPLVEHQHEGLEDRAVAIAPVAARPGHPPIDHLPESQPLEEHRGHHQARPGSEAVAACSRPVGYDVQEPCCPGVDGMFTHWVKSGKHHFINNALIQKGFLLFCRFLL